MLSALLLLGLLPFASLPLLQNEEETEDGPPDSVDPGGGEDDAELGALYNVAAAPGTTELPEFRPGIDIVTFDASQFDETVEFDLAESSDGARFSVGLGNDQAASIAFPDLDTLPEDDIFLRLADPETGDLYEMSLGEILAGDAWEDLGPGPLSPMPDGPDAPGPSVPDGDPSIVQPLAPDAPDSPGPNGPFTGVLTPDPDGPDDPGPAVPLPPDPSAPGVPAPSAPTATPGGALQPILSQAVAKAPEVAATPGPELGKAATGPDSDAFAAGSPEIDTGSEIDMPDAVATPGAPTPAPGPALAQSDAPPQEIRPPDPSRTPSIGETVLQRLAASRP